jgi:sulfopyruvate decarboxylase alpha subunit
MTVFSPQLLRGKTAFITGGGTGICRGIALALAEHGCDIAIASRKAEHLEPTAAELRQRGARAVAVAADVRDPVAVDRAIAATIADLGRLDILINGAAGNFICAAENLSPNGFGTVVDIDLKGTFNVSRAALPHLKQHGGSVINISATLPYLGTMGQAHAASAKAGIDSLTPHARLRVGTVRHPRQRHCARTDRGHRRREAPDERRVSCERDRELPARAARDAGRHRERHALSLLQRRVVRERRHPGRRRRAMAALGTYPGRSVTIEPRVSRPEPPLWAAGVCDGAHSAGITDLAYVPDNPLSFVLGDAQRRYPAMRLLLCTREEEAFGIAAGLYLGGKRPAVMLQSSGLGNSINALTTLVIPYRIPMLVVVSMRGDEGEWNAAQAPMGQAVRPILDAIHIPHVTVSDGGGTAEIVTRAAGHAFASGMPYAILLPRKLTTS